MQTNKVVLRILRFCAYAFGGMTVFIGVVHITDGSFFGLIALAAGLIILPNSYRFFSKKTGIELSRWARVLISIVLILVFQKVSPPLKPASNTVVETDVQSDVEKLIYLQDQDRKKQEKDHPYESEDGPLKYWVAPSSGVFKTVQKVCIEANGESSKTFCSNRAYNKHHKCRIVNERAAQVGTNYLTDEEKELRTSCIALENYLKVENKINAVLED